MAVRGTDDLFDILAVAGIANDRAMVHVVVATDIESDLVGLQAGNEGVATREIAGGVDTEQTVSVILAGEVLVRHDKGVHVAWPVGQGAVHPANLVDRIVVGRPAAVLALELVDKDDAHIVEVEGIAQTDQIGVVVVDDPAGIEHVAVADGHFVHVFVNRHNNQSVPIPDMIRKALERIKVSE